MPQTDANNEGAERTADSPPAKSKGWLDKRTVAYAAGGMAAFGAFLAAIGARMEPPTIAMLMCFAALGALLLSMYRMVAVLSRPAADVVVGHEAVLSSVAVRELREEKRRVLRAINELEFDFEMGKLSPNDYRAVRDAYELRAIEAMRALDTHKGLHPRVLKDLAKLGIEPATDKAGAA